MQRIDLSDILQRTVSRVYDDLVTRRTGQAVRGGVAPLLEACDQGQLAVIDFSLVRCLDYSCADEIVGKLLLQFGGARYILLVGLDDSHLDAIEPVLERHALAVVAQDRAGGLRLLGSVPEPARAAFRVLAAAGHAAAEEIAAQLAQPVDRVQRALDELHARRLVREEGEVYQPLRCA